ncbi:MAG: hypothetical protein R3337_06510, partial [Gammaproteobacteria bacterium]|nr:hypothetical protein [Gammaproteobacteria bacterium]
AKNFDAVRLIHAQIEKDYVRLKIFEGSFEAIGLIEGEDFKVRAFGYPLDDPANTWIIVNDQ